MTHSHHLHDHQEREKALNPRGSFIVQAPAGSGKTELLTQRYLLLLSYVKQPEEILAITFTKKSAAEMRARIIKALKNAFNPEPDSLHEKKTWQLAKNALHQNELMHWSLLDNPNRLQIQTIDSFNASLTRQLPLLSNFGGPLEIADDPLSLYREAVQEFLTHLEENFTWAHSIETLLRHLDNDIEKVETLLINMLAKRDQWMRYTALNAQNPQLRESLEQNLIHIIEDTFECAHQQFPKESVPELLALLHFAAKNLLQEAPDSPIIHCLDLQTLPTNKLTDKNHWLGIAKLLLTDEGTWRKSVNKKQGFPSPSDARNASLKSLFNEYKLRIKEFLDRHRENENLRHALKEVTLSPNPFYSDNHWETLKALHEILHVMVAQLKLIFQEHGKIDYIENAQAAFISLGTEDEPTDITLALDYKIQHILIDEFQDTSNSQSRLLQKLISGWQHNDGRTLFVVGDPMQSIYRFREAEVGLFIKARQKGLENSVLEPLTLSVNFRSQAGIVNWVNDHFSRVMPSLEDIATGAVSYSSSIARQDSTSSQAVQLHSFVDVDDTAQAHAIVQLIQNIHIENPDHKIAILVRSRTQLKSILPALKNANLLFRSLEIEPLNTRPIIQDLLALTQALLHPADRIAWLSILRAPWCGLTLSDLLILAGDKSKSILWEEMQNFQKSAALTSEGQIRLQKFIPVMEKALAHRRRQSLREYVESTWLYLGGPACIEQHNDLEDAEAFFKLLEKLDLAGDLPNLKLLHDAVRKLYAAPNNQATDSLQIMTIHNAKGLEFDVVILPHLEKKASQDDKQLLQWMERTRPNKDNDLILAPIEAVGEEENAIYSYIKRQQGISADHENGRLLYVAATRAKKQLHLLFNLKSKDHQLDEIKEPTHNSLLKKLWPALRDQLKQTSTHHPNLDRIVSPAPHSIKRLSANWQHPLPIPAIDQTNSHQNQTGFKLQDNNPKLTGVLIHRILQSISLHGREWWSTQSNHHSSFIKTNFINMGMLLSDISVAESLVEKAINNTLSDSRGQWILHAHKEAQSEYPLTTPTQNLVIDRTFIDENGIRWIIDYKSAVFSGNDLDQFLTFEQSQYETQLWEYYCALKALGPYPIRIGLYFPLIPAWKEWSFDEHRP